MKQPLVSIIIPLYNRADLVQETLNSVLTQTYPRWEALVVDDGSEDNSQHVAASFAAQDERIHFFQRKRTPKGANTCRNIGLEHANGDYVIFLDSDDLLSESCLEDRITKITSREYASYDFLVFPQALFKRQPHDLDVLTNIKTEEMEVYRFLRLDTVWLTSQPIWKTSSLEKITPLDEELQCWQDLDLNLLAFKNKFKYEIIDQKLPDCFLRVSEHNRITNRSAKAIDFVESKKKVILHALSLQKNFNPEKILASTAVLMTSTINNHIKAGNYEWASHLIKFARGKEIYNAYDYYLILLFAYLHQIGFRKIRGFYTVRDTILRKLAKRNLKWARIKYTIS